MDQWDFRENVRLSGLWQNRIAVKFSYNPNFMQKFKSILGYKWHPQGKYCLPASQHLEVYPNLARYEQVIRH